MRGFLQVACARAAPHDTPRGTARAAPRRAAATARRPPAPTARASRAYFAGVDAVTSDKMVVELTTAHGKPSKRLPLHNRGWRVIFTPARNAKSQRHSDREDYPDALFINPFFPRDDTIVNSIKKAEAWERTNHQQHAGPHYIDNMQPNQVIRGRNEKGARKTVHRWQRGVPPQA